VEELEKTWPSVAEIWTRVVKLVAAAAWMGDNSGWSELGKEEAVATPMKEGTTRHGHGRVSAWCLEGHEARERERERDVFGVVGGERNGHQEELGVLLVVTIGRHGIA
jgi:hypothetical protein